MKKILYMHTGSGNHGCEALVRTTAKMLSGPQDVILWSLTKKEDEKYGSSRCVEEIVESEQIKRFSGAHLEALIRRKLLKDSKANQKVFLKKTFKDTVAIAIGGDNYCYPWSANQAVELDKEIRKHCRKNVLWGCSIDPEAVTPEIERDLAGYDLITAREPLTYELLKKINPNTVKVADPAFLLSKEELPLPDGFAKGKTVGINVSPLIMEYGENSLIMQNYELMIEYILHETDLSICLIPHVVWEYNDDRKPCRYLYEKYNGSGRVCMVEDGNCEQLKGYIARCSYFVGARTHATIAAYSSCVPTLVVGYSVKSRGIAMDLFGNEEQYVLPVQKLKSSTDLTEHFRWLMEHAEEQKKKLESVIPDYKQQAFIGMKALEQIC